MNKPEKIQKGLGFDPGATHSLGKGNRIPGRISSGDFSQLVPAYTPEWYPPWLILVCLLGFLGFLWFS